MTGANTNSGVTWQYRRERDACFDRYKRRREQVWARYGDFSDNCKTEMESTFRLLTYELALNDSLLDARREYYGLRRAA